MDPNSQDWISRSKGSIDHLLKSSPALLPVVKHEFVSYLNEANASDILLNNLTDKYLDKHRNVSMFFVKNALPKTYSFNQDVLHFLSLIQIIVHFSL